jgi:Tol biopolymer transport system component
LTTSLASGARLGAYEVLSLIGAGGMGEVYRARDTRLGRTVAIKVLPEQFAADPERRERFERECRAVAALNHPNICDLYDVGEAGSSGSSATTVRFLVMEYLEGQTLAERLVRGPLSATEMLRFAVELADALDHAHRRGLVHRDLKPGNIMITKAGVKLLDFGLSKHQRGANLIALSTLSPGEVPLTAVGEVLGTYPYIAPEQLMGREADARSDIFAFGAIVHEMATGRRAFGGTTAATVIGAVLHIDPPAVSSLQPMAPPALDRIVTRCLAKDSDDRWQTARDLVLELKWIADSKAHAPVAPTPPFKMRERMTWLASGLMFVLLLLGFGAGIFYVRRAPFEEPVQRLSLLPPLDVRPAGLSAGGGAAISPDGRRLAFVATADGKKVLWVRALDLLDAEPLPATEGATYPFWSPDSQSIGFFAEGKLKRIAAAGGQSQTISDALQPRGGTWSKEGIIVFLANAGERWYRVAAAGGSSAAMTIDAPNTESYWPFFLPDGRHFLFFGRPEKPGIYVASLDSTAATLLLAEYVGIAYAPGYLLTLAGLARNSEDRTLVAMPFDATRLQISGPPSVIAEHVAYETLFARAAFSSSQNGRVVYETEHVPTTQLIWFDREGKQLGSLGGSNDYRKPSLSPDDTTVAVERPDPQTEGTDIWLLETTRGIASRLTVDPAPDWSPVWSPDGSRVVFTSPRNSFPPSLYQQDSRGAGPGEILLRGNRVVHPRDWSSDGRFLVYDALDPKTQWDISILPMEPGTTGSNQPPVPFLQTEFNEYSGQFSADGRLMAYMSDETGTFEVYVAPFPAIRNWWRKRISNNGGSQPRWRRDGKELFYIAPDGTLMAVPIAEDAFEAGTPRTLFKTRIAGVNSLIRPLNLTNYAVTGDGQRFLITSEADDTLPSSITVLSNWPAALAPR